MEGRELAKHLGFGDGLRISFGYDTVSWEHPTVVLFRADYEDSVQDGMLSRFRLQQPAVTKPPAPPPRSLFTRLFGWMCSDSGS